MAGRFRAGVQQSAAYPIHQLGVRAIADEFEFPLPPTLLGRAAIGTPARGDLVVAELGDDAVVGAVQQLYLPGGADSRHRTHRAITHDGQHHIQQFGWNLIRRSAAQGYPHLGAGVGARRQLQMPARVEATGAAAQRDSIGCQITRSGVEVHSLQCLRLGVFYPGHSREAIERRRLGGCVDVELALDFEIAR